MADLLSLSRSEHENAKTLFARRSTAHCITAALGIIALVVPEPAVFLFPIFALVSETTAWGFRKAGQEAHERAERGHRAAAIGYAFGEMPNRATDALILTEFSDTARAHASEWEDPAYFDSSAPVGLKRYAEVLLESAFWSTSLYRAAAQRLQLWLALTALVAGSGVLALFTMEHGTSSEIVARSITTVLATLIASDLFETCAGFASASSQSKSVVDRLSANPEISPAEAIGIAGDYAQATVTAAPIPTRVYEREFSSIEEAWAARTPRSEL